MSKERKESEFLIEARHEGVYEYASFFLSELEQLKFEPRVISGQPVPEITVEGQKVISFATNNVLGLGVDAEVLKKSAAFLHNRWWRAAQFMAMLIATAMRIFFLPRIPGRRICGAMMLPAFRGATILKIQIFCACISKAARATVTASVLASLRL